MYFKVASFLEEIAKYEGAVKVYSQSRQYYMISSQNLAVAKVDECVARIALLQAHFKEAEATLEKVLLFLFIPHTKFRAGTPLVH